MPSVSVSNLDFFRVYQKDPALPLQTLMARLYGSEPRSDAMKAGNAFHEALERASEGVLHTLASGDYRFDFKCDCEITALDIHELSINKTYGDLTVRGRVDAVNGTEVVDYKTMSQFDADRLLEGYQFRYYLDMMECDKFRWEVFVLNDKGNFCYEVTQHHTLTQYRYPNLHADCERLAQEYCGLAKENLPLL